jgi:hypothetical protein
MSLRAAPARQRQGAGTRARCAPAEIAVSKGLLVLLLRAVRANHFLQAQQLEIRPKLHRAGGVDSRTDIANWAGGRDRKLPLSVARRGSFV